MSCAILHSQPYIYTVTNLIKLVGVKWCDIHKELFGYKGLIIPVGNNVKQPN